MWRITERFLTGYYENNNGYIGWAVELSNWVSRGATLSAVKKTIPPDRYKCYNWKTAEEWWTNGTQHLRTCSCSSSKGGTQDEE